MMYRKPSRRWVALKAAYLLPLSALALVAFSRPQTLGEIEQKVEQEVTKAVAAVVQSNDEPAKAEKAEPTVQPAIVEVKDTVLVLPDANLVKADLADQSEEELQAKGLAVYREVNELTDSVMQAVGARRIAEGIYVGHFQPNLNSDTVRICHVKVLNKQSQVTMASGISTIDSNDPLAYELTLQAGTRKGETGYYIRYLQPVNSSARNYDKPKNDPKMLSTDSVLTKRSSKHILSYSLTPLAIKRSKQDTRIFMYTPFNVTYDLEYLIKHNDNIYKNMAIVDEKTGDKYVCRLVDYSYFKHVKDEIVGKDTIKVYQVCLVFPPIGKQVKEAYLGSVEDDYKFTTFNLNDIPRKGRVITH